MGDVRIGRIVCFLTDVKAELCLDKEMVGGYGYIAALGLFDRAIEMLLQQMTQIENLENLLKIEKEENARYHEKYGEIDFDGEEEDAEE